jgi:hypothetical protein
MFQKKCTHILGCSQYEAESKQKLLLRKAQKIDCTLTSVFGN